MVMRCLPGALPQARVVRAFSPLLVLREQLRSNESLRPLDCTQGQATAKATAKATARATTTADPYGMTNKGTGNGKSDCAGNCKGNGNGRSLADDPCDDDN